jgi:hypothetical protein
MGILRILRIVGRIERMGIMKIALRVERAKVLIIVGII